MMKPLRQERRPRAKKANKPVAYNARESWVIENPDGYVLRRRVPEGERVGYLSGALSPSGWWESSVASLDVAREAARNCPPDYLIYAVRDDGHERRMALVTRSDLLKGTE